MLIDTFDEIIKLDQAIDHVLTTMNGMDCTADEYSGLADQLTKLMKNKQLIVEMIRKNLELLNQEKEADRLHLMKGRELDLKELDQTQRAIEASNVMEAKLRELQMKGREVDLKELDQTQRANEASNAMEAKLRELQYRREEFEDTFALRKREIDLKQLDIEKPDRVSKDALVAAGTSIAGIILIIGYERMNVITSKALSFIMRSR